MAYKVNFRNYDDNLYVYLSDSEGRNGKKRVNSMLPKDKKIKIPCTPQTFDKQKERFYDWVQDAGSVNNLMGDLAERLDAFCKTKEYATPSVIFSTFNYEDAPKGKITLLEYIGMCVRKMQDMVNCVHQSTTWSIYQTLYNLIKTFPEVSCIPIDMIDQNAFEDILSIINKGSKAKHRHTRDLRAIINKYCASVGKPKVTAPKGIPVAKVGNIMFTFSAEEMDNFENFNPDTSGKCKDYQLMHDTCLLIYYLYSRPIDVLSMKIEDFYVKDKVIRWRYNPIKLENRTAKLADVPVCRKAKIILDRYIGDRSEGYVLPYHFNKDEELKNDVSKHLDAAIRKRKVLDKYIKKAAECVNIKNFKKVKLYTMRHSAFTLGYYEKNISLQLLASYGGTSAQILSKHYINSEGEDMRVTQSNEFSYD